MMENKQKNNDEELITRVYENKKSKQKLVCIPKKHKIKAKDFVRIIKLKISEK